VGGGGGSRAGTTLSEVYEGEMNKTSALVVPCTFHPCSSWGVGRGTELSIRVSTYSKFQFEKVEKNVWVLLGEEGALWRD